MEQAVIEGTLRQVVGKGDSHRLRREKQIPAVFYGKGQENVHLSVNPRDLEKAISGDLGMNTLLKLKLTDGKAFDVMLRDYQANAIKRNFTHADFILIDLKKKIHIKVPMHLEGRPEGLKEGGILEHITREIDVLCFPTKIPREIIADVTALKIGQNLHLNDVKFPEGVEPREKINITIAAVSKPREEVVEVAAATMVEPEVLTAKKEDATAAAAGGDKKEGAAKGKEGAAKDAKPAAKPAKK